ncbi:hypothetical protein FJY71_01350 [candidate division WOR-3 bacterium]|nr:hypothetical protein [candidate division WOR-3 bacterium]
MTTLIPLVLLLGQVAAPATDPPAPPPVVAPSGLKALDTPNDQGKSLDLRWAMPDGAVTDSFVIERAETCRVATTVGVVGPDESTYVDSGAQAGRVCWYRIGGTRGADTAWGEFSAGVRPAAPRLRVAWAGLSGAGFDSLVVQRAETSRAVTTAGSVGPEESSFVDEGVLAGHRYSYRVGAVVGADTAWSEPTAEVAPVPQWVDWRLLNIFVAMVVFFAFIVYFINHARKGRELFVRRIAGLDAVEESVGRATEMGKPIVFIPGIGSAAAISTIASMNILGEIAKKTAQYDTTLVVPNSDPVVYTIAREMVKEAHAKVGRPDSFKPDNVFFITQEQFAYAAAVDGIMVREKPATNFLLGYFAAESLILAETGATTGAIQIAGTDAIYQLPFFITACDYTLIGEELYAASAYLSREPLLLGSLVGQDYGKLAILVVLALASALYLLSAVKGLQWLEFAFKALNT